MRRLLVVVLVAALAWGGYWFIGARAVESGLTAWIDQRRAEGWAADYATLSTRGFPNRFDTTIADLQLADPHTGVAWSVPFFQILALSYRPNHVIAVWPGEQTVATPLQSISLTSDTMRASVVLRPGPSLELDRSTFELANVKLESSEGWLASVETGSLGTRQTVGKTDTHDIGFDATGVRPSRDLLKMLNPGGSLPDVFERLHIETTVAFDTPWNRYAIEDRRPQITNFGLNKLDAKWGQMDLQAAGDLDVDAGGIPTGRITVRATNWREMLQLAVATGVVAEAFAPAIERALELLAQMSGNPETLDAPLSFQNGLMSFGPIPLGQAPKLVIR
ncbi:MAG: DUF2125 domain-containing protein [Paracoccaceae bacterium]